MRCARGVLGLFAFLVAALLVAGPANARHDPAHPFAGEWEMQFPDDDFLVRQGRANTATIELKASDPVKTKALARDSNAFRWGSWAPSECGEAPATLDTSGTTVAVDYYVGTFTRGADSGALVGCVHPVSGIIHVVFKSGDGEGGFATAGGPGGYGIFPFGQPTVRFNGFSFLRHLPDDGSKPEEVVPEGSLCGRRTPAAHTSAQAAPTVCKLDRVVFVDGTNAVQGVASSKRAVIGQRVYFLARVASTVVPADLVLLFPKEVGGRDIEVVQEAKSSGLGCKPLAKLNTGTHAGKPYLVCTIDRPQSRVLVSVIVPKALSNKPLEVLLLVGKPKAPGQAREWIAKQKLAVDVEVEVVQPKPAPPKPAAQPAAARDRIEGQWVEFVPKPGRILPGKLVPLDPPPFFPDADVRITKAQDANSVYHQDIFATVRGSQGEIYLNAPKSKVYLSGAASLIYDGAVAPAGVQLQVGKGFPVQLELISPGAKVVAFPELCLGVVEQAKVPILCGLVEGKRVVLRRVSD